MTLQEFECMIKELDSDNIYYIVNLSRMPLFACNYSIWYRVYVWFAGGHFSPIIGYIYDKSDKMWVLIADCNKKYGDYMVSIDRLYEATRCKTPIATSRGLIRFEIERKTNR